MGQKCSSDLRGHNQQTKHPELNFFNLRFSINDFVIQNRESMDKNYVFLDQQIGKGAFGHVFKVQHKKTGAFRAFKVISNIRNGTDQAREIQNELTILKKLDHPNIIRIYEYYQYQAFTVFVMEYCAGGNLAQQLSKHIYIKEVLIGHLMNELLSAVAYCHKHHVVHRDLKPENILFTADSLKSAIKLVDFGISKDEFECTSKMRMYERSGTLPYMAPEMLSSDHGYDEKCDVWSCGVIMYFIITGRKPYNGTNNKHTLYLIQSGEIDYSGPEFQHLSLDCMSLIRCLLARNASQRISATQALQHKWLKTLRSGQLVNEVEITLAINNFRKFKDNSDVEKVIWSYFVSSVASEQEKEDMLKVFKMFDTNGDGQLSRKELLRGFRMVMINQRDAEREVDAIMRFCDVDRNGHIDFSEFVTVCMDRKRFLDEQNLRKLFNILDKDESGYLSSEEVFTLFYGLQYHFAWFQCSQFLQHFDDNQDGQLSFLEFKAMMFTIMGN